MKKLIWAILGALIFASHSQAQTSDLVSKAALRVCADPANYPMSTQDARGFENDIAQLLAAKLELPLEYIWYPMSTGFVRNTLAANECDVIIGFSAGHELVLNTNPYYTSTHILVTKANDALSGVEQLSDERLKNAKIGVIAGSPAASHLARYGLLKNIKPYQLFADRRYMNPNQDMIDDLSQGEIDIAIMWGPLAAPMIGEQFPEYNITALLKEEGQPFLFARITMGVRQGELEWKRKLNSLIRRHQNEIDQILRARNVPLLKDNGKELKVQ